MQDGRDARTAGDGAKAFLPCSVPDLQLDGFVVEEDLFDLEVDTVVERCGAVRASISTSPVTLNRPSRTRWL